MWRKIVQLSRLNKPVGTVLLMLPCWWGVALAFSPQEGAFYKNLFLFALGALMLRSAGCIFNDFADRNLDAKVARTKNRPLAARTISKPVAFMAFTFFCIGGMAVFLHLKPMAQLFAAAAFLLLFIYPWMKRLTHWPQLILGFAFNSGVLVAYGQTSNKPFWPFLLLYSAGIFWTLAYDTIYAFQDYEDDLKTGIKSTAILFKDNAKEFLSVCYGGMGILCLALAYYQSNIYLSFICFSVWAWAYLKLKNFNPNNPKECMTLFQQNTYVGAGIFLGLALR
jgi:4-hydroxybenzoate polyprenyltransferase